MPFNLKIRVIAFAIAVMLLALVVFTIDAYAQCPLGANPLQCARDNAMQAVAQARVDAARAGALVGFAPQFGAYPGYGYPGFGYGYGIGEAATDISIAFDPDISRKFATAGAALTYRAGQVGVAALASRIIRQPGVYQDGAENVGYLTVSGADSSAEVYLNGDFVGTVEDIQSEPIALKAGRKVTVKVGAVTKKVRILAGRVITVPVS